MLGQILDKQSCSVDVVLTARSAEMVAKRHDVILAELGGVDIRYAIEARSGCGNDHNTGAEKQGGDVSGTSGDAKFPTWCAGGHRTSGS